MKTTGKFFRSLVMAILFFFFVAQLSLNAQNTLPDSVIFTGTKMDIGEKWRISGFPSPASFGHYTINSYFKEPDGTEHVAYVDNYKLYYLKSTDDGKNWSKEQILTSNEGDIRNCALTVDTAGKVFIGISVNNNLNYANPSGTAYGSEWYFDLYCVNNKTGSWAKETVNLHSGNYGALIEGLFVDADNNIHLLGNYYGWYSNGGTAWEWIRNAGSNTWGARGTIVQFTDAPVDRFIYDAYVIAHNQQGQVTLVLCRETTTTTLAKPRLFYVRYNGSSWQAPVVITDSIAVAWNRYDAVVDPDGHTYIAYLKKNKFNYPELKIIKDFEPPQAPVLNLAAGDTINYFRMHCNAEGLFTMYLYVNTKNPKTQLSFSKDALKWTDPITIPDEMKNYMSGIIVKTDTRRGYFTDYCKQVVAIAGPRSAQPYGPDTLMYGSIKLLETNVSVNAKPASPGYILKQNYPNPFSNETTIAWQLPEDSYVVLKIYDHTGREVRVLVDGEQEKGEHNVTLDASGLLSGIYFFQLQTPVSVETKKMIISR